MNDISFRVYFVEASGEKYRTIQAGVESTQMVDIIIFHFDASQNVVPYLTAFCRNLVYVIFAQLFQVQFRLFGADERRSYTYIYLFAFTGFKADQCAGMLIVGFQFIGIDVTIGNSCRISKRLVKLQYEVILEVCRNTAAVLGRITDNLVFRRDDFHKRTVVESIYNYIRVIVLRESEAECCRSFCRSNLGYYIMVGKVYFVIVRSSRFCFMREPAGTLILIENGFTGNRHDGELTVIIDPGAGLVGLFKTSDFIGIIGICPAIPHFSGLGNPKVHSPGKGDSGISVSGR